MEKKAVQHYITLIRSYFSDQTEEGQIAKYAKMAECEYWMEKMLGIPKSEIHGIYNHEYWGFYGKGGRNAQKH